MLSIQNERDKREESSRLFKDGYVMVTEFLKKLLIHVFKHESAPNGVEWDNFVYSDFTYNTVLE